METAEIGGSEMSETEVRDGMESAAMLLPAGIVEGACSKFPVGQWNAWKRDSRRPRARVNADVRGNMSMDEKREVWAGERWQEMAVGHRRRQHRGSGSESRRKERRSSRTHSRSDDSASNGSNGDIGGSEEEDKCGGSESRKPKHECEREECMRARAQCMELSAQVAEQMEKVAVWIEAVEEAEEEMMSVKRELQTMKDRLSLEEQERIESSRGVRTGQLGIDYVGLLAKELEH